MNKKGIILLSGGLDSLVSLGVSKDEYNIRLALTFDYGQNPVKREIKTSKKIADYYGCSTDYLLGRTEIKSQEEDVRKVCEAIGFDEEVLDSLKSWSTHPSCCEYKPLVALIIKCLTKDSAEAIARLPISRLSLSGIGNSHSVAVLVRSKLFSGSTLFTFSALVPASDVKKSGTFSCELS